MKGAKKYEKLGEALSNAVFENGVLNIESLLTLYEGALNVLDNPTCKEHLRPMEIISIVSSKIMEKVSAEKLQLGKGLSEAVSPELVAQIKAEIERYIDEVPRKYELWVPLPLMPTWGAGDVSVTSKIRFVETTRDGLPKSAEQNKVGLLGKPLAENADRVYVYVVVSCFGYGSSDLESTAVSSGLSLLKQFFQLLEPKELFEPSKNLLVRALVQPHSAAVLVDVVDGSETSIRLEPSFSDYLLSLKINESKLELSASRYLSGLAPNKLAQTREEKEQALSDACLEICKVLDAQQLVSDSLRIRTAAEWLFDSERNENQTLAMLQACIGLEALLGDEKRDEAITPRLADRCAYLLGEVESDRDKLRVQFKKIYDARSKVVHGRRARLAPSEQGMLFETRTLLQKVVRRELWNFSRAMARR